MGALTTVNSYAVGIQPAFAGLPERYIAYLDASQQTVRTYSTGIKQFVAYLQDNDIPEPVRETVIAFREHLRATGHKPTTIQNYITAIRLFFRWTYQEGLYPNIADHVKGAKLDREHKKDCFTQGQVKQILAKANGDTLQAKRNYAILITMFTCGLRTIEVSRANIEDLRNVGGNEALFIQGKGHEEKTAFVNLPPMASTAIHEYLSARGKAEPTEPLFASTSNNNRGQAMTTRSISAIAKKSFQNAGYDSNRLTAHSTRHTAVTLSLQGGESLENVQGFARHQNIATTMIYSHNLDMQNNHCSRTIEDLIFS